MRAFWFLLLATACPVAVGAATADWTMTEASGPVQVMHGGVTKVASRGGILASGDIVKTGVAGRAVLTRGEEYLMIAPASQVRVPVAEQPGALTKFIEDFGNVVFMIKKRTVPHFAVQTPYLAAVVKGTTFSVSVTETGASVKVLEGAVDVATVDDGAHQLVIPGTTALVDAASLGRMRVQANGIERVIESTKPAAPDAVAATVSAPAPADNVANATTATDAVPGTTTPAAASAAPATAVVATIYEEPVSLAETTAGLVTGELGASIAAPLQVASVTVPVVVSSLSVNTPVVAAEPATVALASATQATRTANEATRSVIIGIETASATVATHVAERSAAVASMAVSAEADRVVAVRVAAETASQQAAASIPQHFAVEEDADNKGTARVRFVDWHLIL